MSNIGVLYFILGVGLVAAGLKSMFGFGIAAIFVGIILFALSWAAFEIVREEAKKNKKDDE